MTPLRPGQDRCRGQKVQQVQSMWNRCRPVGSAALILVVYSSLSFTGSARVQAAGSVAAPGLSVHRGTGEEVILTWPGSCRAGDTDFEVYEGALNDPSGLEPVTCTTGSATTFAHAPATGNRFFLVVPRNATHEGSYGLDSMWVERLSSSLACLPQEVDVCLGSVVLADIDSGQANPTGQYRWMDVANQLYSIAYRESYNYTQADVVLQFFLSDARFRGHLIAANLKPNFVYQVKLAGIPGTPSNEQIGLSGRWWQEEWNGTGWSNGQNLNNKGDGTSPSPNDAVYFSRRDMTDPTSPTGYRYRYVGYLPFDYIGTDEMGNAMPSLEQSSAYHVMWKTIQRTRTALDGPPKTTTFDVGSPDPAGAYDMDYSEVSVTVFGEWERLPVGGVILSPGVYEADLILTEESFHGSGLAGGWAAAVGARIGFEIVAPGP
jgi:hypothetical protein